jgi:NitT/TauT family transport system substrate-binding protein
MLAGVHVGCWQVFGTDRIQSLPDLKGKTIAVSAVPPGIAPDYIFATTTLANLGIDPHRDVNFVVHPVAEGVQLLAAGQVDAVVALPPRNAEMQAKKIGHVVLDSMVDRPWSDYFCCVAATNRDFLRRNPVATKRALRALLRGADLVAHAPERVARLLVDKGLTANYDYAVKNLRDIPYGVWRDYDNADTVRFYALRLKEAGFIQSTPQQILDQGTDYRFVQDLKKELKS